MKRAIYDKQFKMAAVKLVQSEDCSVKKVANELSISGSSLRRWINECGMQTNQCADAQSIVQAGKLGQYATMKNMEKVHFQAMEMHFSILHMR